MFNKRPPVQTSIEVVLNGSTENYSIVVKIAEKLKYPFSSVPIYESSSFTWIKEEEESQHTMLLLIDTYL